MGTDIDNPELTGPLQENASLPSAQPVAVPSLYSNSFGSPLPGALWQGPSAAVGFDASASTSIPMSSRGSKGSYSVGGSGSGTESTSDTQFSLAWLASLHSGSTPDSIATSDALSTPNEPAIAQMPDCLTKPDGSFAANLPLSSSSDASMYPLQLFDFPPDFAAAFASSTEAAQPSYFPGAFVSQDVEMTQAWQNIVEETGFIDPNVVDDLVSYW